METCINTETRAFQKLDIILISLQINNIIKEMRGIVKLC